MPLQMMQTSTGQYLTKAGNLQSEDRLIHPPSAGEVQIAVRSTTLCGSDMHYFQHGRNGSIEVRQPLCLGHEAAGEVVATGTNTQMRVGDRVAIECGIPCDSCELCLANRYNLCPKLRFRGSGSAWPHFQGTMQTRINHPAKWTHLLPHGFSYEEGALLEPLSVVIHACNRVGIKPGSSCTIIGAGAIGLLCALAARRNGCDHIAIVDIVETRVRFALDNGFADVGRTTDSKRAQSLEESLEMAANSAEAIAKLLRSDGTSFGRSDYTFECTGVESCVQTAIFMTKTGGKVALVGMGTPNLTLPVSVASAREIDIVPTWRYAGCYMQAIELVADLKEDSRLPQVERIITHKFNGISKVGQALQTACSSQDAQGNMVVKVAVMNDA